MGLIGEIFADAGLHVDSASFAQYSTALQGAEGKISEFASGSQAMLAGAFTLPAVALGGIAAYGVSLASGFQDAGTTLTTLYGSADIAKEKFQWMTDFAATTPFQFDEIVEGGIKLKAYGMDIEQYGRTFGDAAAGMGKGFNDVIEAVADAQTGEFERMKEFGIKAIVITKANIAQLGVDAASIGQTALTYADRNGKQMVEVVDRNNREMITSTIATIWNDKYAGAMEARSKTFSGMMSNLRDNLEFGLADLVGYDMKEMEVQTASLMGVLMVLSGVAVTVTGSFKNMSEPLQTFTVVAALGVASVGLLAAGMIGYSTILPFVTGATALFGVTLSAAILPVALVVGGIALLAAGLVYLNEKTGIVSAIWTELADEFTIMEDRLSTGWTNVSNFIGEKIAEIKAYLTDIIPESAITAVNDFVTWSSGLLGGATSDTHEKAETIRARKATDTQSDENEKKISDIFDPKSERNIKLTVTADTTQADQSIQTLDGHLNELPPDAAAATTALTGAGNVPASGTIAGLQGIQQGEQNATGAAEPLRAALTANGNVNFAGTNAGIVSVDTAGKKTTFTVDQLQGYLTKAGNVPFTGSIGGMGGLTYGAVNAGASANKLTDSLTRGGQVSFGGTISQIGQVNSKGQLTSLTAGQLQTYLRQAGDVSFSGTQGQLVLVDAAGKRTNLTTQAATNLLKTAGSQSMSGTIGGINGITTAWGKAQAAANAYAKSAIAQRETEKTYESAMKGSTSTGQSKGGVSVVGAGQTIKSTNTVINNTYHQPTASDKKAQLAIIGRS